MNNQVAINFLDQVRKILLDDKSWLESTTQPINEAFDIAISALEKQIPKKVRITTSTKMCSVCGRQLSGIGNIHPERNYCQRCGQAIDWRDNISEN